MVTKLLRNLNFSDFSGIKSEMNQCEGHIGVSQNYPRKRQEYVIPFVEREDRGLEVYVLFAVISFLAWFSIRTMVGIFPPSQTPTQKSKNRFSMSNSHEIALSLVSFDMFLEALPWTEIAKFLAFNLTRGQNPRTTLKNLF